MHTSADWCNIFYSTQEGHVSSEHLLAIKDWQELIKSPETL